MTDRTLNLIEVSKRYHMGPYVISNFTYEFDKGSATALIGPNGSGKTTLMRILSTAAYPTSGKIMFGSLNIHEHPHQYLGSIGVVPDEPDLPQYLTAVELLEWILRSRNKWNGHSGKDINELLDVLMLDERRNNVIGTYSSGMIKKTQIAVSLISQPAVLLMDEPFRGLDEDSRTATMDLLIRFKKNNGLLILSSHMKSSLEPLCDNYITFPLNKDELTVNN
jgi:ABC-2 type transport system ATP-binding protein